MGTEAPEAPRSAGDEALLAVARLAMDASVRAADDLGGLSPVQLRALTALTQRTGANLAQLADDMGVAVSTASRLVDRLVAAGWVHRRTPAHNRREIRLTLTPEGTTLLRGFDDRRLTRLRRHLDAVAADRQEAVVAALVELSRGGEVGVAPASGR